MNSKTAETAVTKAEFKKLKAQKRKEQKGKAAKKDTKAEGSKGKLGALLGFSVISVMRCMGKHGWTFEDAEAALKKAKIPAATHTIKRAIKRGQKGELKIAPLSKAQLATLKA